jgi:hypothetical protein
VIAYHFRSAFLAGRYCGHRAPGSGPDRVCAAPVIVVAPGWRIAPAAGLAGSGPGAPRKCHQPVPLYRYGAPAPLPDTGPALTRGPLSAGTTSKRTLQARFNAQILNRPTVIIGSEEHVPRRSWRVSRSADEGCYR